MKKKTHEVNIKINLKCIETHGLDFLQLLKILPRRGAKLLKELIPGFIFKQLAHIVLLCPLLFGQGFILIHELPGHLQSVAHHFPIHTACHAIHLQHQIVPLPIVLLLLKRYREIYRFKNYFIHPAFLRENFWKFEFLPITPISCYILGLIFGFLWFKASIFLVILN